MNDLILHSYRRCPFAIRVRMTLEEKNLDYKVIEENLSDPSTELLRYHPEGKVPLLIHHGIPIHESAIITEYLEDVFPLPSLRISTAMEKAQLRMRTFWCDQIFKPDLDTFKYEWQGLSEEERASLLERLRDHLIKMETPLKENPFLMGNQMTLADIHLFPFYRQLQKAQPDFSKFFQPKWLNEWLERIIQRPSFERVMKKQR